MALGIKKEQRTISGEQVWIRSMNGGPMAVKAIELSQKLGTESWLIAEVGALMVCCCLCDESGSLLYTDPDKVRQEASFGFLAEFATAAMEVSGLKDDAEAIRGNLPADQ